MKSQALASSVIGENNDLNGSTIQQPNRGRRLKMRHCLLASLLLLMDGSCSAFQLQQASSSQPMKMHPQSKRHSVSIPQTESFDDTKPEEGPEEHDASKVTEASSSLEQDVAVDLFLENSEDNLALAGVLGADDSKLEGNDYVEQTLSPEDLDVGVKNTVNAILAASEQAVAKAEASLSDDLSNRLDAFADDGIGSKEPIARDEPPVTEILPATSVVGDSVAVDNKIDAPSVGKILRFAIPATGVWLCDPLLSLIDTSAVGMLSGTIHQAALTPACAVTDYAALLIAFVFTATTNLIAAAQESDRGVEGSPRMTRNLVGSLQLSTYVGAALGSVLFVFARRFVQAIVGSGGVSPAVIEAATIYVKIRALGMPAAAIIGSAQAACLGMQDIKSQFIVLAAAAGVNFLGDMILVGSKSAWIGGAAGAAWATVLSQYVAVAFFAKWLCHKPKQKDGKAKTLNLSKAILDLTGKKTKGLQKAVGSLTNSQPSSRPHALKRLFRRGKHQTERTTHDSVSIKPKTKSFSVRGFLEGRAKKRDLVKLPSLSIIKEFWPYFLPVTFAQIGRVSGYVAMSYVVASSLGTLAMAAQQIIASLVYCLFPVADSLSLTGQSFVPPIAEKTPSKERARALRQTMVNLCKAAGIFGLFTAGVVGFTPLISHFFTSDPSVISMVNGVVPLLAASFPVYALVMAFEGLLLGQKDLGFQGKMYTSWCFVVPYFMLRVKKAALGGAQNVGINAVWGVLGAYQVVRFLSWAGRALVLQRRTEREARNLPASL